MVFSLNSWDWDVNESWASFTQTGPSSFRTTNNGVFGAYADYFRAGTKTSFQPPYEVTGEVMVRDRLEDVKIISEDRRPTWAYGVCFHPVYQDNDHNVVVRFWNETNRIGASVEYGGYLKNNWRSRSWYNLPDPPHGVWHKFRLIVPEYGRYGLVWNDRLVGTWIDKSPRFTGPQPIGLRLDFFDVEFRDMQVRMDTPFRLISRQTIWPGQQVLSSGGNPRPALGDNLPYVTVHYTGAGTWADFGDTIPEIAGIQNWATSVKKPWEYNWAIDTEGNVVEWAGMYRAAHSAGENDLAHGVLFLLGIKEKPTEAQILAFRQLRWWLQAQGKIAPNHEVRQHNQMPGASTTCPGPDIIGRWHDIVQQWEPQPEDDLEEMSRPPILWRDERYQNTYMVFPSVAPLDQKAAEALRFMGAVDTVGRHHTQLKALARMCGHSVVTTLGNVQVNVDDLKDGI